MRPGDKVVVLEDPLNFGPGVIKWVEPDGRLMVAFLPPVPAGEWTPPVFEAFDAHELELYTVWMQAA